MFRPIRHDSFRLYAGLLSMLILSCLGLMGCEGPGFVAYVIAGPPTIKAQYKLQTRPTLVIVDDPLGLLGDPNYPAVVGANVGYHLSENGVLPGEMIISQDHLTTLAAQLGDRYPSTPIDEIGQRLKAEQVIHVLVRSADLMAHNTYYHPKAQVEVRVVDVASGKRLFPEPDSDMPSTSPGTPLQVSMKPQAVEEDRRHARSLLARRFSEYIGLCVAQLFYDHAKPDDASVSHSPS